MKIITTPNVPIKAWTDGVLFDEEAQKQLKNLATLPFVYKHLAVMPDVHVGKGSTIGTVMATRKAIIPAAVGVDLGCGMMAVRTNLMAQDLPDNLGLLRSKIEEAIPVGSSPRQKIGQWNSIPNYVMQQWNQSLADAFDKLCEKYPRFVKTNNINHLGTLGGGNHFIEICLDEHQAVWFMLHSGSRGIGNAIGTHFIELARKDMQRHAIHLPDKDLAYFSEGSAYFHDYCHAVEWAQNFAAENRRIMMRLLIDTVSKQLGRPIVADEYSVNCHHNYVQREQHFGREVWVTRKGAVSAQKGQMGIIPGSMGAKSFIVRGLGNPESFHSCSHGAGRVMSRTKAKQLVNLEEHRRALDRVECKKDASTLDETPKAYKDIDAVMAAQKDLVEIVYTLKQILCVKG
ncbi:RtcB family protein [Legionella saoudiensis]|uniref:RtcB family protein n=1 Tax=Legionella saoudiensis TaxID=1750561 RepID=UPI000730FFBB|nr:RtcB family protein [Legionella saoudiensis]